MRSCERPRKRSASEALPSSVSNRYSLSIRTHGSSCRRRASSSLRRVSSFSPSSSSSRAASHSFRVPVMCFVIALLSFLRVSFIVRSLPSHVHSTSCAAADSRFHSPPISVLRHCHAVCWLGGQEGDHRRDLLCLTKALSGNKLRHRRAPNSFSCSGEGRSRHLTTQRGHAGLADDAHLARARSRLQPLPLLRENPVLHDVGKVLSGRKECSTTAEILCCPRGVSGRSFSGCSRHARRCGCADRA